EALTHYCDPRMALAFKHVLSSETNEEVRWQIVTALAKCGGFSDDEMAAAVEAYASMAATAEGQEVIKEISSGETDKSLPLNVMIRPVLSPSAISFAPE